MISLVAQCGRCGIRWATGGTLSVQDLGHAVALLAKSVEQGAPVCINCSGGTASDAEVQQHERAVELAKGTNLPACPYCEAVGSDMVEMSELELEEGCCETGAELGWWGGSTSGAMSSNAPTHWHRKSLEERPS